MKRFFDTNIVVYANSGEPKAVIARSLVLEGGVISVQVLNESAHVMRRKMGYSWKEVHEALIDIETSADEVLPLTHAMHKQAVTLSVKHDLNIYDSLIIASALEAGCTELLTEDMQHGQRFGKLTIRNPFL